MTNGVHLFWKKKRWINHVHSPFHRKKQKNSDILVHRTQKTHFNELIRKIDAGRAISHTSSEPIYYLVFSPKNILEVKRQLPAWEARLSNNGWEVKTFSVSEHISDLFTKAPMRSIKLKSDLKTGRDFAIVLNPCYQG